MTEQLLKIFKDAKNAGRITKAEATGDAGDVDRGDLIRLYFRVDEDDVITDVKFQTFGGPVAIAVSSVVCDMLKGKLVTEAAGISKADILDEIGEVPHQKMYTLALAEEAIKTTLLDFYKNKEKAEKKK